MNYLNLIDIETKGPRNDVTPLFADYKAFSALVKDLLEGFSDVQFDDIAGIDALGFILGSAMAMRAHKGLIPIRKGGKLPVEADRVDFVDYTGENKSLELRVNAVREGQRVLLVDEWVETGAQVSAAIKLIEGQGDTVVGVAAIAMDDNERTARLRKQYRCWSVWQD